MAVKTITYTYKTGGLYVHSDETLNLSSFTRSGDTGATVAKILSITASTSINQHASSSSTDCSIAITINYSGGSATSTTATKANLSRGSTKSVTVSWNDVSGIASNWSTVTTVVVDKSGGTYTNWQKYPLIITITFDDTQYKPQITNFTMTRCNSSGTDDPQGTYVKLSAKFSKTGSNETRTDRPSSIKLKYGSTTVTLASSVSTINSSWLTTKTWGPTSGFSASNGYTFTLTFTYYGETVSATASIAPGLCNFALSSLPTGGVSIGKKPSSTSGNPMFESQYLAYLYNGIAGLTRFFMEAGSSVESTEISIGRWGSQDSRQIYRKRFRIATVTAPSSHYVTTSFSIGANNHVHAIFGSATIPNGNRVQLGYTDGTSFVSAYVTASGTVCICTSVNLTDVWVTIDYEK